MRSDYWDGWKGVAMLAVVAIHACGESGGFPVGSFNWYFGLVLRQLVNFAVPLFLALSGFFAVRAPADDGVKSCRGRLARILPPYLFWTLVFILLKYPAHLLSPAALMKDIFLGTGIGIGYFVVVLVQFILITPLIFRINKGWRHLLVMAAVTAGSMWLTYTLRLGRAGGGWAQFPAYALPFFAWYPFYHLGLYAAQRRWADGGIHPRRAGMMFALFLLFTMASVVEGVWLAHRGFFAFGVSQIKLTSFLASISLFMFAVWRFNKSRADGKGALVPWLGRRSYPLYLTHLLFLPPVGAALKAVPSIYAFQPLFILLSTVLTLAACAVLIRLADFALPAVVREKCLGVYNIQPGAAQGGDGSGRMT